MEHARRREEEPGEMLPEKKMIERMSWEEFRAAGLLWWINRALHLFGWAIVLEIDEGSVTDVYPARCRFRGFSSECETEGFTDLTNHVAQNVDRMLSDLED